MRSSKMTNEDNKIPIKGYASFHPLKHCMIGRGFEPGHLKEFFPDPKILNPMTRIANETEEDFLELENIMKKAGVKTYRPALNMEKYESPEKIYRPPITPRDHFGVIGEKLYALSPLKNKSIQVEIVSSHYVDPKGERVRS